MWANKKIAVQCKGFLASKQQTAGIRLTVSNCCGMPSTGFTTGVMD